MITVGPVREEGEVRYVLYQIKRKELRMRVTRLLLAFGLLLAISVVALGVVSPNPGVYAGIPLTMLIVLISALRLLHIPTR